MNRISVDRLLAVLFLSQCSVGLLSSQTRAAATRLEVPAGAADSVVVVTTEFQGQVLYAETGLIVASDDERSTIYVNARPLITPMEPLPGKPEERTATAIVGRGPNARRVPLVKSFEMTNGTTLYTAKKSELPAPLPKTSDVVAQEGMSLLLIGCDIGFAGDTAGPEIVAVKAKVDRIYHNAKTLEAHLVVETEAPLNLRTGILTTPEGKIVSLAVAEFDDDWRQAYSINANGTVGASKVKVTKDPRAAPGHRRFVGKPLAEIERAGAPEITFLNGNFKIADGTARVDVAMAVEDPFGRLKNPRLLVSTNNRNQTNLDGESGNRNTIVVLIDAARVTVRDGVWIDRTAGDFEVPLTPKEKFDLPLGAAAPYPTPDRGKFYSGNFTFPAEETLPFVAQCVVDDEEGRVLPLGKSACLRLYPKLEVNGPSLLKRPWQPPAPYTR